MKESQPAFRFVFLLCLGLMAALASCTLLQTRMPKLRPPFKGDDRYSYTRHDSLTGGLNPMRSCYDVTFYDLDVEVDVADRTVRGVVGIRFKVLQETDSIQVDLYKNMAVHLVTFENHRVLYRREHNSLFLDVRHLSPGEQGTVWITYSGTPLQATHAPWSGGFVWKRDRSGFPLVALTTEQLGPSFWWPNKDHPSDEPDSMSIRVTAPSELTAVSNGRLKGHLAVDDTRSTWHWYVSNPINTSNVTLNLGHYVHFFDTLQAPGGDHQLHYYVLPQNYGKARKHFQQTKRILRTFEDLFGPYPWWQDGYKVVEAPFVGMEHQSAIAYGNGYSNERNYQTYGAVDYILLHETAHEWWGNSVTACDPADQWLHEGFATYAEVLYIERTLGRQRALDYLQMDLKGIRNRHPLVGPCHVGWHPQDGDIYGKGAWVLHTLRGVIQDDTLFLGILRTFATRYRGQVVCTQDFIHLVEDMTGKDMGAFFQQYLHTPTPPTLEYYYKDATLHHRWVGVPAGFEMPVDVIINLKPVRIQATTTVRHTPVAKATQVMPDKRNFFVNAVENPALGAAN